MQLLEKKKNEIITQSYEAKPTKSYGTTRYARRKNVSVIATTHNFDNIDMNAVFKTNQLMIKLPIEGETARYDVVVLFRNICDALKNELKANEGQLEYKVCYRAIIKAIEHEDIYISCSCDDWKYRMNFWATKGRYNAGDAQLVPAKITNPNNDQGAGCKHVLKVLSCLDWACKVAMVLNNYIDYINEYMHEKYVKYIYPVIYDEPYEEEEPIEEIPEEEIKQEEEVDTNGA